MNGLRAQGLVTGGASGIGLATAALLAAQGARGRRASTSTRRRRAAARHHAPTSPTTPPCAPPSTRPPSASAASTSLVNNAGIGAAGTVEDNADDEWHRVLDVNVLGMVRATRAALPHLRRSAHAAIVNTCSIARHRGPAPARAVLAPARAPCSR